jgi:hypothetical protein
LVGSLTETAMIRVRLLRRAVLWVLVVLLAAHANAQQPQPTPPALEPAKAPRPVASPTAAPVLERKAIDILQASSRRLATARSMRFTAVVSHESPSRLGQRSSTPHGRRSRCSAPTSCA